MYAIPFIYNVNTIFKKIKLLKYIYFLTYNRRYSWNIYTYYYNFEILYNVFPCFIFLPNRVRCMGLKKKRYCCILLPYIYLFMLLPLAVCTRYDVKTLFETKICRLVMGYLYNICVMHTWNKNTTGFNTWQSITKLYFYYTFKTTI